MQCLLVFVFTFICFSFCCSLLPRNPEQPFFLLLVRYGIPRVCIVLSRCDIECRRLPVCTILIQLSWVDASSRLPPSTFQSIRALVRGILPLPELGPTVLDLPSLCCPSSPCSASELSLDSCRSSLRVNSEASRPMGIPHSSSPAPPGTVRLTAPIKEQHRVRRPGERQGTCKKLVRHLPLIELGRGK